MGHAITGVVVRGRVSEEAVRAYDLKVIPLEQGFELFALEPGYVDYWASHLGIAGALSERPLLNMRVVHHLASRVTSGPYAIIETEYFGGHGTQAAAVYDGSGELMAPEVAEYGPINRALRLLGVSRGDHHDEFDALGLTSHRDFGDSLKAYWER